MNKQKEDAKKIASEIKAMAKEIKSFEKDKGNFKHKEFLDEFFKFIKENEVKSLWVGNLIPLKKQVCIDHGMAPTKTYAYAQAIEAEKQDWAWGTEDYLRWPETLLYYLKNKVEIKGMVAEKCVMYGTDGFLITVKPAYETMVTGDAA